MRADQSDAEGAIRALNEAFVRHFNAGDADGLARAVYAEDARLLPPDRPMIVGRTRIAKALREFLEAGMGGLTVDEFEVEVAESGEVAYAVGAFSLARPVPDRSKFVEVYRRQADGSWRCVVDAFSSDGTSA